MFTALDTVLLALVVVQLQRALPALRALHDLGPLVRALAVKLGVELAAVAPPKPTAGGKVIELASELAGEVRR